MAATRDQEMELPPDLHCVFSGKVIRQDGSYIVEIPANEVSFGGLEAGDTYKVAMLSGGDRADSPGEQDSREHREQHRSGPPVNEEEIIDVEIEDIGDQGDGIARVGPGYVIIVPETELGERVAVEIEDVKQNMAFGAVTERYDNR